MQYVQIHIIFKRAILYFPFEEGLPVAKTKIIHLTILDSQAKQDTT